jgi:hypothetical protein
MSERGALEGRMPRLSPSRHDEYGATPHRSFPA